MKLCGNIGNLKIALGEDGNLYRNKGENEWENLFFHENYKDFYPVCRLEHLIATNHDFVAAGFGVEDRLPYLFRSLSGGVWDMIPLKYGNPCMGYQRIRGRVTEMLFDHGKEQIFLLCENGELVTVPDCPKCMKVRKIADQPLVHGEICGEYLQIILQDGSQMLVPMDEITQVRVALGYAKELEKKGGTIIDLTKADMDDLPEILKSYSQDSFIAFICQYGKRADAAASYARSQGFNRAFSIGGRHPAFHEV